MSLNSKHNVHVDQLQTVVNSLTTKSDDRFAKGANIEFSTDANNQLSATKNGNSISFPGEDIGVALSIVNGKLCVSYGTQ